MKRKSPSHAAVRGHAATRLVTRRAAAQRRGRCRRDWHGSTGLAIGTIVAVRATLLPKGLAVRAQTARCAHASRRGDRPAREIVAGRLVAGTPCGASRSAARDSDVWFFAKSRPVRWSEKSGRSPARSRCATSAFAKFRNASPGSCRGSRRASASVISLLGIPAQAGFAPASSAVQPALDDGLCGGFSHA